MTNWRAAHGASSNVLELGRDPGPRRTGRPAENSHLSARRSRRPAAIGIVRGRPFEPNSRRRGTLEQAAQLGAGIARTLLYKPRDPDVFIFEGASWKTAFVGGSYEFLANGARLLDYRALMHYFGTGITPAMTHAAPGIGSQYAHTVDDANGNTLDGAKAHTLTLPAPIPVKTFWAVDIYDTQTRSLLQTDNPYPSINDRFGDVHAAPNGHVVIHLDRTHPRRPTSTGCGPSLARAGSRSCASTARSKPGSTRPGNPARSKPCSCSPCQN